MSFSRHFLTQHNFLLTKVENEIDDEQLMQHVLTLNKEAKDITCLRELADCRHLKSVEKLTVQGTTECASQEINKPGSLLAILVPDSPVIYGMARAYQMFSEDHRKAARVFNNLNDAIKWLSDNENELEIFMDFIDKT